MLRNSDSLNYDDGSRYMLMANIESDLIKMITEARSSEKRAGDISRDSVKHIDNKGRKR